MQLSLKFQDFLLFVIKMIQLKKKVTLKKKIESPSEAVPPIVSLKKKSADGVVPPVTPPVSSSSVNNSSDTNCNSNTNSSGSANGGGRKKGLWLAVLLLLLFVLGGYYFAAGDKKTSDNLVTESSEIENIGSTSDALANVDSVDEKSSETSITNGQPNEVPAEQVNDASSEASSETSAKDTPKTQSDITEKSDNPSDKATLVSPSSSTELAQEHTGKISSVRNEEQLMARVKKETVIQMVSDSHIVCLFDFDSCDIVSCDVLERVVKDVQGNNKKVVVKAYADVVGDADYNQYLSERRAKAVCDYFIKRGIDATIIEANGFGESTEYASDAENRRADIVIE